MRGLGGLSLGFSARILWLDALDRHLRVSYHVAADVGSTSFCDAHARKGSESHRRQQAGMRGIKGKQTSTGTVELGARGDFEGGCKSKQTIQRAQGSMVFDN